MRRLKEGKTDLREIPACIGGDPKSRTGIVLAKSIPAKKYGIVTGEPVAMAIRKCPGLVIVPADFRIYEQASRAFKSICESYAPEMESFSIDEVFLDMTGTSRIYEDPIKTAYEIKDKIRETLGFTVNVGIGNNKLLAKMASDFQKPDRVHTLFADEIETKMWPLPVGDLLFVGKKSAEKLMNAGIKTIGELANAELSVVQGLLGQKMGLASHLSANGIDDSPVVSKREAAKGYSVETTVEENLDTFEKIDKMLLCQADIVAVRLRKEQVKCRSVAVTFRTIDFVNKSHQTKLLDATDVTMEIYEAARKLIRECWNGEPLRLIGLALSDVTNDDFCQMSLFMDERHEKMKKLDGAMDSIRNRFGNDSIKRASTLNGKDLNRVGRKYRESQEKP